MPKLKLTKRQRQERRIERERVEREQLEMVSRGVDGKLDTNAHESGNEDGIDGQRSDEDVTHSYNTGNTWWNDLVQYPLFRNNDRENNADS